MSSNRFLDQQGQHALFSPSQSSWIRYDDDKIRERLRNRYRAPLGTEIHEYAASQIIQEHKKKSIRTIVDDVENYIFDKYVKAGNSQKAIDYGMALHGAVRDLPKDVFDAVKDYINDGIIFKMTPESALKGFDEDIFGTPDTLSFRDRLLRIHDLKTGEHPTSMEQLEIYASLYCLTNEIRPNKIDIELRIYHMNGIAVSNPEPNYIWDMMKRIEEIKRIAEAYRKDIR